MDIKWSYYLIAIIYILVIILRIINENKKANFKKQYSEAIEVLTLKRDFFTTVSLCCIVSTLFINISALIGGKPINKQSIIVTLLVIGFTVINSISHIYLSPDAQMMFLLGYELKPEEIENAKVKDKKSLAFYDMTFTKEIDSYNYIKFIALGKNKEKIHSLIDKKIQ